ncbi:MAG: hypothetical protein IJW03_03765 [Clostridia bacterium]|nr:hypothetical protein [Clostridia bacterium]
MKINSEKLRELAALPDNELWREIRKMAEHFGQKIPEKTPPHSDMERIRAALCGTQLNLADAMQILRAKRGDGK